MVVAVIKIAHPEPPKGQQSISQLGEYTRKTTKIQHIKL
jgi:hypothetical protein